MALRVGWAALGYFNPILSHVRLRAKLLFAQNNVVWRPLSMKPMGFHAPRHTWGEASLLGGAGCLSTSVLTPILPSGNVINTNCSAAHSRQALSCKMAVEYDKFIESGRK